MGSHLIKAEKIIVGDGSILHDAFIAVENGKIVKTGTGGADLASSNVLDFSDRVVMPGIIDTHLHISGDGNAPDPAESRKLSDEVLAIRGTRWAELLLSYGITTIADAAGRGNISLGVRESIKKGFVRGPRFLVCGRMITITGGRDPVYGQNEVDGPDDVRRGTREEIARGVDFIKLAATGAISSESTESMSVQFNVDEMRAATEEAHNVGIPTHAHAYGDRGIENTIKAGVDVLVHGHPLSDENLALMKEYGTLYMPTLVTYYESQLHHHEGQLPEHMIRKEKELWPLMEAGVKKAVQNGIEIVLGSDSGLPYTPFGKCTMEEMELLVRMGGMSESDAIVAGTLSAARSLRIDKVTGSLESGKSADLLILQPGIDPLKDIKALQNPENLENVMLEGKFLN
ncbi:MAG: amidohydrolase family protein [Candidatus Thorarchaeota archaeon]|jgi:imidazolonepropionase-like amidohydrolase